MCIAKIFPKSMHVDCLLEQAGIAGLSKHYYHHANNEVL